MLKVVDLPYTAFNDLKPYDEYIRVGGMPVRLRDIKGQRIDGIFRPEGFGDGRAFDVFVIGHTLTGREKQYNLNDEHECPTDAATEIYPDGTIHCATCAALLDYNCRWELQAAEGA